MHSINDKAEIAGLNDTLLNHFLKGRLKLNKSESYSPNLGIVRKAYWLDLADQEFGEGTRGYEISQATYEQLQRQLRESQRNREPSR